MRHHVTATWSLELPDEGAGDVTDAGDLVVTAPGRTIVVSPYDAPPDRTPADALAELRAGEHPPFAEEHLGEEPDGTVWWAFVLEEDDDGHRYTGLYGYVLTATEWLQLAVLVDDDADRDWALDTWRSVSHHLPT